MFTPPRKWNLQGSGFTHSCNRTTSLDYGSDPTSHHIFRRIAFSLYQAQGSTHVVYQQFHCWACILKKCRHLWTRTRAHIACESQRAKLSFPGSKRTLEAVRRRNLQWHYQLHCTAIAGIKLLWRACIARKWGDFSWWWPDPGFLEFMKQIGAQFLTWASLQLL